MNIDEIQSFGAISLQLRKPHISHALKWFIAAVELLFAHVSHRYPAYGGARHGQGDPGPVPGAAPSQRHGGTPGRIIRDHHRHSEAH